jgi:branched-chain amino acid transport system substrate-binding protein
LKTLFLYAAVAAVIFAAGCGPDTTPSTPQEMAARAEVLMRESRFNEALELYSSALAGAPDSPRAGLWQAASAEALAEMGRDTEALARADRVINAATDPEALSVAYLASALAQLGSPGHALSLLARMDLNNLDGHRIEKAGELARELLGEIGLEDVSSLRKDDWLEVFVLLELERRYALAGDSSKAAMYAGELDRLYPGARERWGYGTEPSISGEPYFALVMPMTGEGSEYAQQVQRGVALAFERFTEMYQSPPLLRVVDLNTAPGGLEQVFEALGRDPDCMGVIGPLTSSTTLQAASYADRNRMPVLSPTATSEEVDRAGNWVFRLVVSQGDQAAAMAEYAVLRAGCRRLAIIHPHTAQANGEVSQFRATVERLGATVVATEGYQSGATDFRTQINRVKNSGADGVFMPVSAWDAIQIAPQLRFYRVGVPLFGTSGWDSDLLLRHGSDAVEGAVFTAASGLESTRPETAGFVYAYRRKYDQSPSIIAAQGYDAAGMLLDAWHAGSRSREGIRTRLSRMGAWFGASGRCVLGSATDIRASWPMLTVREGEILGIE